MRPSLFAPRLWDRFHGRHDGCGSAELGIRLSRL